jgi:hypothetical protein
MVKAAKKTLAELIAALDSSTLTLADILHDLEWASRERERCRLKDERKRKALKEAKEANERRNGLTEHEARAIRAGQPIPPEAV